MKRIFFMTFLLFPLLLISESYTLEGLIDVALQQNTSLKQSQINLDIAGARRSSSRINFLPDISSDIGRTEDLYNNTSVNSMSFSVSHLLSLNYDAYFVNKNAKHDFNSAVIANEIQMQNTIYEIIQSYISVLENQKRLELLEKNIQIQESIVFESEQLFRQNRITQFEVQQSEINLLNSRISALSAQNRLNQSRNRLFDLINIIDEGKKLEEVYLYENEDTVNFTRNIDFEQILQIRQHNETAAKHRTNITQTKLNFYPEVRLRYSYGRGLSSEDWSFDEGRTAHTVGLNVSYSLNSLFRNRYSMKTANLLDEHYKLNTNQLLKDISLRYNQYLEELNHLQQMNLLMKNILHQTTTNQAMAQQRYRLGLTTQLDLDRANRDQLEASINMEVNQYELMLKKLSIDHLLSNELRFIHK